MNIADHANGDPGSPAVIVADGATITYAELYERSQRVAALLHEAGLRRGDGVALVLPNRPEFFEITWGCQLSGLYYSAVNTHFTADEVAYVICDSEARAVFIDESMAELAGGALRSTPASTSISCVGGTLPGWSSYEDTLAEAGDPPPISDGSEMLYSSGTTGRPKAVRRPLPEDGQGSWAQKVLEYSLAQRYDMTPASVYLSPAPLYHAAGVNYTMAVHRVGAASIMMGKFDAETVLRLISEHRVTHAQFVPTMFVRMLKLPDDVRSRYDVSSLQCVIHAAAPCPVDVKHRMMDWFGPIIHEYYGGTEGFAGTIIGPEEWLAHPGSVGKPFSPVHVVGEDGAELPAGESGELYFEGGPAFEYFKDPAKTASVSNDRGWRSLGDMGLPRRGRLHVPHRPLDVHDRLGWGEHLPAGGREPPRHAPEARRRGGVRGAERRVRRRGQGRRATCRRCAAGPELEAELIEYCRANLATYKCPRTVEFDAELPRDPNGKLYKRRIRERYWQGRSSPIL